MLLKILQVKTEIFKYQNKVIPKPAYKKMYTISHNRILTKWIEKKQEGPEGPGSLT